MSKRLKTSLVITFLVLSLAIIFFYFIFHFNIDTNGYAGEDHGEVIHDQEIDLVDTYLDKAIRLMFSHPDSARFYAEKGLELATGVNYSNGIHRAYTIVGSSYLAQSHYKNALDAFFSSLEIAVKNNNEKRLGYAYNNIGVVYYRTGKYRDAIDSYLKAKELSNSIQDSAGLYSLKNNIGQIYDKMGEHSKAKDYYFQAYEGFLKENDLNNLMSVSTNIANYYAKKGIADSAFYFYTDAASLANEQNNVYVLISIKKNKGKFLRLQGDYNGAIDLYYASDSLAKTLNVTQERSLPLIGLSKAYLELNDFDRAMHYAGEVQAIAEYYYNNTLLSQVYEVYADIYKMLGDYEHAFHYYYEAKEFQAKSLSQAEAYGVFQVELEHLNRQIEMRDFEMERKQLVISKNRNTFMFVIIILVLSFISLVLAYFYNLARVRQTEKERQHQNEIIHSYQMNRATLEAENNERKRLGMELHDGLGPLISLTKLNISNVLEGDVICQDRKNELLEKSSDYLDEILKEMRTVSNNLAPLILMEKGLEYALHDMLSKVNSVDNYSVHVNISGMNGSLANLLELALYRTIQEIINNIVKHAQADEIVIDMVKGEESITVIIEDNGKGFIVDEVGAGMGLLSAKSRIESLKGNLLIDSKPGRGTIVSIILPLSTHSVGEASHT